MIQAETRNIMLGGLNRLSRHFQTTPDRVQIQIKIAQGSVCYHRCLDWQPAALLAFREILGRIDFLGYEALARPYMTKAIMKIAAAHEAAPEDVSAFVYVKDHSIGFAIAVGTQWKQRMGLEEFFDMMNIAD